jgi:hypothetical protein
MEDAITWFAKTLIVKPNFAGFVSDHGSLMEHLRESSLTMWNFFLLILNLKNDRYNCNRYDEDEARAARDAQERSRAALQRYLFYCNRYMNHMQSLRLEHKHYATVKEKMEEMQQHNMSWIEVRRSLQWRLTKKTDILLLHSRYNSWKRPLTFCANADRLWCTPTCSPTI